MLPKPIRDLKGDEAKRYREIDARPVTEEEIEATERSLRIFHAIKPRRK